MRRVKGGVRLSWRGKDTEAEEHDKGSVRLRSDEWEGGGMEEC